MESEHRFPEIGPPPPPRPPKPRQKMELWLKVLLWIVLGIPSALLVMAALFLGMCMLG